MYKHITRRLSSLWNSRYRVGGRDESPHSQFCPRTRCARTVLVRLRDFDPRLSCHSNNTILYKILSSKSENLKIHYYDRRRSELEIYYSRIRGGEWSVKPYRRIQQLLAKVTLHTFLSGELFFFILCRTCGIKF